MRSSPRIYSCGLEARRRSAPSRRQIAMTIDNRDKDGPIAQEHGNTLIWTLRDKYGVTFAQGESNSAKLIDIIERLDEPSLRQLTRDHGR